MKQPSMTEKQIAELADMLELAQTTEQQAKELCEIAEAFAQKWERRLEGRQPAKHKVSKTE